MSACRRLLLAAAALALIAGRGAPLLAPKPGAAAAAAPPTTLATAPRGCKLSEHRCASDGLCVAQDKFCDGENDCEDKSDEPVYCTPCNRTLYGDVGRTYELQVRRPREERLPFLCHLNFTAAGHEFGDLVQLTFDTFTVGRFLSFTTDGCPYGHMTINEEERPATGGQWCGSAWGYTVYYSETRSVNLTLYLSRLSGQGNDFNFDFKLSYKFLRRSEAHLRYGNSSMSIWRGELVNATYCDRVFTRCDTRACRLQSPNYPGVYPRNVTCYYRIEQKRAPPGHQPLLVVSQRNSHKIHIKDQVNKYDTSQRTLRVWDQCNVVQDYLTVYDGGSTSDRVLVRLCGGDAVPDIVGSRDTMLLEFHTSPYDNPFHPVPLSFLPGFELEVQVIFVDERSSAGLVAKEDDKCDFYISSQEGAATGLLENPRHSLPPNTTCRFHFQGRPGEIVWLAFVKYYAGAADPAAGIGLAAAAPPAPQPAGSEPGAGAGSGAGGDPSAAECNAKLLIWNGERSGGGGSGGSREAGRRLRRAARGAAAISGAQGKQAARRENATLLGEFCKDESPRLCDHSLLRNGSRHTRPCSMSESYVSSGRHLTLEHVLRQGSALYPVSFVVRYEFVHQEEDAASAPPAAGCARRFVSGGAAGSPAPAPPGPRSFGSPRSVFLYGRGGSANLSCVYRFEAGPEERLELTIGRAAFGGRSCASRIDPLVNRWSCERPGNGPQAEAEGIAELRLAEYPWQGVRLPRDCLCSNLSERLVFQSLTSARLELSFVVSRMNVTQDYRDFFFEAEYRFVPAASVGAAGASGPPAASSPAAGTPANGLAGDSPSAGGPGQHQQHQQPAGAAAASAAAAAAAAAQACHGSSRSLSDSPRLSRLEERRLRGTSGEISLRSPPLPPASSVAPLNSATSSVSSTSDVGVSRRDRLSGLATIDESLGLAALPPGQDYSSSSSATSSSQRSSSGGTSAAEVTHCVNEPWLIEPEDSRLHFLYLKTPGFRLNRQNVDECPTRNRIVVYPAANTLDRTVVCPAEGNGTGGRQGNERQRIVDLISGGWNRSVVAATGGDDRPLPHHHHQQQHSRSFVVEFLQQEPGYYVVTWMAISKRLLSGPGDNFFGGTLAPSNVECPYRCPELEACISSVLWCDGVRHCPSGFDEREENCSYRFGVTLLYVAIGAGALGIFLVLLLATGCLKYCLYRRRRQQRRRLQKKLPPQASSDEQQRLQKKVQVHMKLSVNHLNSPTNHSIASRNNGTLDPSGQHQQVQQQQQPRYANATFGRAGRSDPTTVNARHQQHHHHHHLHHHQQQQQQQQQQQKQQQQQQQQQLLLHHQQRPSDQFEDEEDDYADQYAKDSVC